MSRCIDIPVGLWVEPPLSVIVTVLLGLPAAVKPEVREIGTLLGLGEAGRRGVEAGPGVEDKRTVCGICGSIARAGRMYYICI